MKRIRAHHLFCMTLFSGHGYDEAFSENMRAVISSLREGEPFQLCEKADDVCSACPNLIEQGGCALGTDDVSQRDSAVFQQLGLEPGEKYTWKEASQRLALVSAEGFHNICGGCRWEQEGFCSWTQLQERFSPEFV